MSMIGLCSRKEWQRSLKIYRKDLAKQDGKPGVCMLPGTCIIKAYEETEYNLVWFSLVFGLSLDGQRLGELIQELSSGERS